MATADLSVIIPTYNRSATLARALDSVFEQSCAPLEVVVVDDGSTDNTGDLIKQHYPSVRYLQQSNQGVSAARNTGIAQAKGEWIALLDSDDEWLPQKLQAQMSQLTQQNEVLICHTEEIWIRNGVRVNQMKKHAKAGGWIFQRCLPMCAMSPSSIVIHRSVFDDVGVFDETLPACEDYDLWLRTTCRYPVLFIEEPLICKYGGHDDQLSRQHVAMDRFRIESLSRILHSDALTVEDRRAALVTLTKKVKVFSNGARKRGKITEADHCERLLRAVSART